MRKIIVVNIMSLDGYSAGPGNNVMALPMDQSFDAYNLERLRAADTVLLGHTSYEMFSSFWPGMADNPEASPANREFAQLYNRVQKVAVAHKMSLPDSGPWRDTTTIIEGDDVYGEIAKLKAMPGKDIVVFGSHVLWNDLLANGLVDEIHLMIGNVVLGGGTPTFTNPMAYNDPQRQLNLVIVRKLRSSENILAEYAVVYKAKSS